MEGFDDLGAPSAHTRRPPLPKITDKSLVQVPAKVTVRVPKDLFNAALYSGNQQLVQRSQHQRQNDAAAKVSATDVLLQKATAKKGKSLRSTVAFTKRKFAQEFHFDPEETGVFPIRAPELHSMDDFVDCEGEQLPTEGTHPYGWVPTGELEPTATAVRPRTGQIQTQSSTTLPLEFFDSPDMELVQPEARLAEGCAADPNGRGPIGFSRFYNTEGEFSWAPCTVREYDRGRDMYLIEWHSTGRPKWVKRLNLFFQNESRIGFRFRLRQARRRKDEVEREARYHEYVLHLPFRNINVVDERYKARILARIGSDAPSRMPAVSRAYVEDIHDNFRYAVNSAIVDFQFNDEAAAAHLSAANVQPVKVWGPVPMQGCVNLRAFPLGQEIMSENGVGTVHTADIPLDEFQLVLLDASSISFMASTALLSAMQSYYRELDVNKTRIADTELSTLPLPARLADFIRVQRLQRDEVSEQLNSDWTIKVIAIVERLLPGPNSAVAAAPTPDEDGGDADEGSRLPSSEPSSPSKGHVPPAEFRMTEAQRAQVLRFVKMLSVTMADQLRTAVLQSMLEYESMWRRYDYPPWHESARAGYPDGALPSSWDPNSEGAKAAEADAHAWAVDDANVYWRANHAAPKWGADLHAGPYPPLFVVQLLVRENEVMLVPSLEDLHEHVINSFDDIITATQSVDDISVKIVNIAAEKCLSVVALDEPVAAASRQAISAIVMKNFEGPKALLASFCAQFNTLLKTQEQEYVDAWAAAKHTLRETETEIERLSDLVTAIGDKSESIVSFRLISVDTSNAKASLSEWALSLRSALQHWIATTWFDANLDTVNKFEEIVARLNELPDTTEAMDQLEKFVVVIDAQMEEFEGKIAYSKLVHAALYKSQYMMQEESSETFWRMCHWPVEMNSQLEDVRTRLTRFRTRYMTQLKTDQVQMQRDLEELKSEVEKFITLGDLKQVDDRLSTVLDFEARLQKMEDQSELYQQRETIFALPNTDYPQIELIQKTFEPVATLWRWASEFGRSLPEWMDGPFPEIDAEFMASECDKWFRGTAKLQKMLEGAPLEVVHQMRAKLEDFQDHIPLITAMRNPGLRDRHWERVGASVGFAVKADAGFSVSRALQLGLPKHLAAIEEVSEYASKEYSLERLLDKMQGDWTGICFDYMDWRTTGTHILKGLDDIQMLLDDQIVKTQSMRASPYIGPFEDRVRLWETKLNLTQETLDEWLKCQQGWLYLEPIFGSEDIMQQMPNEGRKFKAVDATWRRTMEKTIKNPEVLTVCADDELLNNLNEANKLLDQVQKGLNDYLETKRLAFPRFYFLSNDELLEILSETKDPTRVQPFLRKIFEGIDKLEFQQNLDVTAMISEEGEKVLFKKPFNPKDSMGNVERWLIQVEDQMRESIKDFAKQCFDALVHTPRIEWLTQWPGQVVICIDCMFWTREVADSITKGALNEYGDKCTADLMQVVNKVRGKLTKLERKTLSALIVIDVHARDVVVDLERQGISSESDFEWMSQLRYYWEDGEVSVRMINAQIFYGYEYLGNGGRLVITPLTDRCYRTLMGALHLNMGGAPEGPAGTGKTETTKDLAKGIAMQCVVFNCSDGLDYLAMGKLFKGLASSGAWACFDEFNRIDLEVLSVVAQQILSMQRAKSAGLKTFEFEGSKLSLRPTFAVFITMNPGYAGRSELPDNLKALFRTVAMMVPDYALISEIMLYSSGYLMARDLARKLVATYKLCSEQLSSQSHYDYGMRAVMSVLRAAAANKQKYEDVIEDLLMLRSIKDVNEPKFLAPDVPLFSGILSDLFPGVDLPPSDYTLIDVNLHTNCIKMNVQPTEIFLEKAHQLYEMILVRHGLMLVGYSFGAKTSIYKALASSLGDLEEQGLMEERRVQIRVMNPKSIYMGQLYGQFDPVSHEWKDGVLAKVFREMATDTSPDRKWVMFDGPVDAVWIENMNTVLDDNKKLCLNSGEIIQMSHSMNMIFEVQDLAVASPATVSRCGMVYVEPSQIGWKPLQTSWMNLLPAALKEEHRTRLNTMFDWLVDPSIAFIRKNCRELVPTSDIALPVSLMSIMDSLMDEIRPETKTQQIATKDLPKFLDSIFVFALIWSVGGSTENDGRAKFSEFLRKLLNQEVDRKMDRIDFDLGPGFGIMDPGFKIALPLPKEGSVYDHVYDKSKGQWRLWLETVKAVTIPETIGFNEIIVQTIDTVRYSYILELLASHGNHVNFAGTTGTGKTVYIKNSLERLDRAVYQNIQTAFSAQTNANQVQDIIDMKLDKRRKGIFGPPVGMKCVIFVDDLNMPALEVYGAQPPIELLRQYMDHGGWYDRADNSFRKLEDIQMVCAMGPPGGGRNPVTPRFLRHFNTICITEFDDETYVRIYTAIADWWFRRAKIPEEVRLKGTPVVKATIEIYNTIRAELLPTPAKSHYTYNMRDLSKVFQGMQMLGVMLDDTKKLTKLWAHETLRVFHDRLVSDEDRLWFQTQIKEMVNKLLGLKFDNVFEPAEGMVKGDPGILRNVLFCDFMTQGADTQKYDEVLDISRLLTMIEEYLSDYNAQSKTRMDLVLFMYAAEHICRISRIIKQPYGNALLVGVGGSGRQSLSRIAGFMAEYKMFSIEISKNYTAIEWQEDLRRVLKQAGALNQPTVFIFSDTHIKEESFLEDINNILNTGEVPNLFPKDELMVIMEAVTQRAKRAGKPLTPQSLYSFFVDQCRQNLHLVICMSPVGNAFRERLRKFPSLVNCTTIDWFSEWPADALKSVASHFLKDVEMDTEDTRASVEDMCMVFHQTVRTLADRFYRQLQRHYYATPTSYLELIQTYKELLGSKRKTVYQMKRRYQVGLEKLLAAESDVNIMKKELIELQPKLVETGKEVEETLKVVAVETKEAEGKQVIVQGEEAIANEKAAVAKAIKDECEGELASAIPLLEAAMNALNTLNKNDITEVKSMKSPPAAVKLVMEVICHIFLIKPKRINDPTNPSKKIDDFWTPSQAFLSDPTFLQQLKDFDKDNIPEATINMIRPYIALPEFEPDLVKKASKAAYGLCCWARAMEAYDRVAKVVAPKKAKLAEADAEFAELMIGLNAKKAQLKEVEDRLAMLNAKLVEMQERKKQLEFDVDLCEKKLDRATKLIGGLGGEKTRWTEVAHKLGEDYVNLTGDVLLSSGFIAYLGAFTAAYRDSATTEWVQLCKAQKIPCADHFRLVTVLGDPVKIRDWVIDGLPNDSFSIDNGIMVSKARRWPLLIDPQGQANKWIRSMEGRNKLEVLKLSDGDYMRRLENCIQFGNPVLLENVGEELDPTLEPLLLKSVFKQGGGLCIRLGDATIEYSESFRFYITTKLRNPHYLPEVAVKVTLLNFMITPEGLEDQLLGIVVQKERPELEEEKTKLVLQGAENARQLKAIEDKIIEVLSTSEGNILEDETAIQIVSSSKTLSNDIAQKQVVAEKTEKKIDEARMGYTAVARHVSVLFFNISELATIEPMYQYSLAWFVNLFEDTINKAETSKDLTKRIEALIKHFTYSLYVNVCRSLFEKDKLLFSFSLCVAIKSQIESKVDMKEYRFLLTGGVSTGESPANPSNWLSDKLWGEMYRLSGSFPAFEGLSDSFKENMSPWKEIYDSQDPNACEMPEPWMQKLNSFQKLLVMRLIRPDKLVVSMQNYVMEMMGRKFVEPPPFDLDKCYQDSSSLTPLIFVLSAGVDPMSALLKYAESVHIEVESISLGQGQGPKASKLIETAQGAGGWVVLQNCHLAVSWMPTLERICEQFKPETTNPQFRLWLTSYPSPHFPVSVLQNGVKMTNDPPKGLRANLTGSYSSDPVNDPSFFDSCSRPAEFKKLMFGLCFFHAFVQERLKFGPLGWNVPYQFSQPDFVISARQLQMFLNEFSDLPLKALKYLTGECNYGGRVTDAHDRRTLTCILELFYCEGTVLDDNYKFSPSGLYFAPPETDHDGYLTYIKSLPIMAAPEVFGLHANADITKDQQDTDLTLGSLLSMQGSATAGGGTGRDELLGAAAADIQKRVPKPFDLEAVRFKYPVEYYESMNTVLCQELVRFNRLLEVVHKSLQALQKALKGLVLMSDDLDAVGNAMYDGKVPSMWMSKSYPSQKPLGSYIHDLIEKMHMFENWIAYGPPPVFWIDGFYFTHSFLTGVKQNFARKYKIPIDTIIFSYKCLPPGDYHTKPDDGAYMQGMYVEGARWCADKMKLAESLPKVLFSAAPYMMLIPCEESKQEVFPHYECPLYRTPERRGVLATTGHSTNFVMELMIPSDQSQEHWTRRGVAFLLSLAQ